MQNSECVLTDKIRTYINRAFIALGEENATCTDSNKNHSLKLLKEWSRGDPLAGEQLFDRLAILAINMAEDISTLKFYSDTND